jgi:acetyl-CoA carboxylase biotin carboxyl carrier protein
MEMNPDTIKALLDAFDRSDWQEMTVTIGTDRLHVSRDALTPAAPPAPPAQLPAGEASTNGEVAAAGAPPAAAAAAPAADAAPTVAAPPAGHVVESPSVGLFWRAPSPSSPPFVEVGTRVDVGDTLAIVEVMKLMSHLPAPVAGVVVAIQVDNGAMVEFGDALVVIDTEA